MFWHKKHAQSILEYMTLIVFLLSSLFVFQGYILRAYYGSWKKAGDSFGLGRQYDPRPFGNNGEGGGTFECFFDATHCTSGTGPTRPCTLINRWISRDCYDAAPCDCTLPPGTAGYITQCLACLEGCSESTAAGAWCRDAGRELVDY
ncbi:MAG TPA: hypothetical protein PKU74_08285 [Candidatus Omnitrophota bacterium]|nr:hypothetical protein [Candidatus Omnitrophota bacterium]